MVSERDTGSFFFRGGGLRWWENLERQTDGQGNILVPPSSRSQTLGLELLPSVQPVMLVGSLRDNPVQALENGLFVASASPFNDTDNPVFVNVVNQPSVRITSEEAVDVSVEDSPPVAVSVANTEPVEVRESRPPALLRPDGGVVLRISGAQSGQAGASNIVLPPALWTDYYDVFELMSFSLSWTNASANQGIDYLEFQSRVGVDGAVAHTIIWSPEASDNSVQRRVVSIGFADGLPLRAETVTGSANRFYYRKALTNTVLSYSALLRLWRDDEDEDTYPYGDRFETLTINPTAP